MTSELCFWRCLCDRIQRHWLRNKMQYGNPSSSCVCLTQFLVRTCFYLYANMYKSLLSSTIQAGVVDMFNHDTPALSVSGHIWVRMSLLGRSNHLTCGLLFLCPLNSLRFWLCGDSFLRFTCLQNDSHFFAGSS